MTVKIEYHICKQDGEWESDVNNNTEYHETDHFETFVVSVMDSRGATSLPIFDDEQYAFIDMGTQGISITVD